MIKIVFEEDKSRAAAYDVPGEEPEEKPSLAQAVKNAVSAAKAPSLAQGAACTIAWRKDPAIGECTFVSEEIDGSTVWTVDHTLVDEEYGGRGIAGKLLAAVVEEAKARGALIKPVCSYAVRQFEKKPEYQEIEYK